MLTRGRIVENDDAAFMFDGILTGVENDREVDEVASETLLLFPKRDEEQGPR